MKNCLYILSTSFLFAACCPKSSPSEAVDYSREENWFQTDRNGNGDIFYICSTDVKGKTLEDGTTVYYASVTDSSDRAALLHEMKGVDRRLGGTLNFYAPYYRQMTLESYFEPDLVESRYLRKPAQDIRAAFQYYIKHLNNGRPFILAGFSQGGQAVVDLLQQMPDSVCSRMVAAYALGWHISKEDLEKAHGHIKGAQGATDTGVTICYNTVRSPQDANSSISGNSVIAINPVNWCTDATPATIQDTVTIHLDPATNLLIADGYKRTDHAMLPLFGPGNYHTFEIRWYTPELRQNIQDRLDAFLKKE